MRHTWRAWCLHTAMTGLLVCGGGAIPLVAQDAKQQETAGDAAQKQDDEKPATLREQYQTLLGEFNKSMAEYRQAMQNQELTAEERKALSEKMPKIADYAVKIKELIAAEPAGDVALDAYLFLAGNTRNGPVFDEAVEAVFTHFAQSERLADLGRLAMIGTPKGDALLERIIEVTPHDSVKGKTMFNIANFLSSRDDEASEKRCLELLQTIQDKYAEVDMGRGRKLGDRVPGMLFAIQNLKIGKVAPDIEGNDIDEVSFKLSDYRGKVVVLDFWGDW